MGSRVYAPGIGRFLSIDPTPGGNAGVYDYCTADPINCTDLTGNWPDWGAVLNVVAVVAETVATIVPGPIGTAAGFISAGAYLATGNTSKATEMAITATAQLVGAGLAAKAAIKAVQYASKIGRATTRMAKEARGALAVARESRFVRAVESRMTAAGPRDRGAIRLGRAPSYKPAGNRVYASEAAARAQAKADAKVGGRCRFRDVCQPGGNHVHVDYINKHGKIVRTEHYPWRIT